MFEVFSEFETPEGDVMTRTRRYHYIFDARHVARVDVKYEGATQSVVFMIGEHGLETIETVSLGEDGSLHIIEERETPFVDESDKRGEDWRE